MLYSVWVLLQLWGLRIKMNIRVSSGLMYLMNNLFTFYVNLAVFSKRIRLKSSRQ